ncbi:MAG: hypothetical protein TH68_09505, partial [Candidatus Synechococcus spongiarum 142]
MLMFTVMVAPTSGGGVALRVKEIASPSVTDGAPALRLTTGVGAVGGGVGVVSSSFTVTGTDA